MNKELAKLGLMLLAIGIGTSLTYALVMSYQCATNKNFACPPPFSWAFSPPPPKPEKPPDTYSESDLALLIRATGDRCKQPAVVTPTQIPNGTNYLVACHSNTGTYEITITSGSQPSIKKLK